MGLPVGEQYHIALIGGGGQDFFCGASHFFQGGGARGWDGGCLMISGDFRGSLQKRLDIGLGVCKKGCVRGLVGAGSVLDNYPTNQKL